MYQSKKLTDENIDNYGLIKNGISCRSKICQARTPTNEQCELQYIYIVRLVNIRLRIPLKETSYYCTAWSKIGLKQGQAVHGSEAIFIENGKRKKL